MWAIWTPIPVAATRVTAVQPIIPAYVALSAPSGTILPPPAIRWPRETIQAPAQMIQAPAATMQAVSVRPEPAHVGTTPEPSGNSGDIDSWLAASTVPPEWWPQFKAVAYCESGWHPQSVNGNGDVGLMQLEAATWARYAGISEDALLDPVTNLDVGWLVVQYDLARGYAAFSQWSCAYVLK